MHALEALKLSCGPQMSCGQLIRNTLVNSTPALGVAGLFSTSSFPTSNWGLTKATNSFCCFKILNRGGRISFKEINLKDIKFLKDSKMYQGAINTNEQVILLDKLIPKLKVFVKKNCKINFKNEIKKITGII